MSKADLGLSVVHRYREAVDAFCRRCVGFDAHYNLRMAEQQIRDCERLDCPLHEVRYGQPMRNRPSREQVSLEVKARKRRHYRDIVWTREEDQRLLDWKDEGYPNWWIAAQLRRPEALCHDRLRYLERMINPINEVQWDALCLDEATPNTGPNRL